MGRRQWKLFITTDNRTTGGGGGVAIGRTDKIGGEMIKREMRVGGGGTEATVLYENLSNYNKYGLTDRRTDRGIRKLCLCRCC